MNRSPAREFAFLCVPVLLLAGAGLWISMRPKPVPLHLSFRVEKPTTLEAFEGVDTVWVTQIRGDGAENVRMDSSQTEPFAELQTAKETQAASSQSSPSSGAEVWELAQSYGVDALRLPVNTAMIPDGPLYLNLKTRPVARNSASGAGAPAATPMPALEGRWPIDRAQFAPFDFKVIARNPQIRARSSKVISATAGYLQGETTFDLLGADMNAQTPVDFKLSGAVKFKNTTYGVSYDTFATVDPTNPVRRIVKWSLTGPMPMPPKLIGDLHGRISVGERWPLAFQLEPINLSKAKSGQNLKFEQWPAPIPK